MDEREKKLMELVVSCLSPDLLRPPFVCDPRNPLYGHCYHACEALFQLLGGYKAGYRVKRGVDDDGISHYWLIREDGQILDPTSGQYISQGRVPPYANGREWDFAPGHGLRKFFWKGLRRSVTVLGMPEG